MALVGDDQDRRHVGEHCSQVRIGMDRVQAAPRATATHDAQLRGVHLDAVARQDHHHDLLSGTARRWRPAAHRIDRRAHSRRARIELRIRHLNGATTLPRRHVDRRTVAMQLDRCGEDRIKRLHG